MIKRNGKDITSIYKGNIAIVTVYHGANIVWEAIKSCFANGFWINVKAWSNTDGWRTKNG